MPYLNLDDGYPDHPKVEALSDAAYRLHGSAMFHAARFRLDERLLHAPGDLCESKHCPDDDGERYRLHDFLQWNKPRSWWDEQAEKAAKRKADWAARMKEERRAERE